jgi:long-chain acyl-CoA synthetase
MKRTVLKMLADAAEKYKGVNFLLEKGDKGWNGKTYADVKQDSMYVSAALLELGLVADDKLALLSEGRNAWVIAEYSLINIRCVTVPLSVKLLPEEILFRLNHSEAKGIFISQNNIAKIFPIWEKIENKDFKIIYFDNDKPAVKALCENAGIDATKNILFFEDLLEQGKQIWPKRKAEVEKMMAAVEENDVVTISYTSGTTGNPKGIMLTQLNYYANSNDAMEFFNVAPGSKLLIILPMDHAFAHTVGTFASLARGLSIYFVDARGGATATLKNIPINLKEVSPDFLLTVPALSGNFMNKIKEGIEKKGGIAKFLFYWGLKAGNAIYGDGFNKCNAWTKAMNIIPYKLADKLVFSKVRQIFGTNLKYCVGGGALLDIRQQHFFQAIGVPIYQGYGLTEATPIISANTPQIHKFGTSGMVVPTIKCKILRTDGSEAADGERGEIVIQGDNTMAGYFKNQKASDESLRDGWLYTGDLGYMDSDNFLMVVGREKALLISSDGEKYSPEEIEEAIVNSSHLIAQVMIHNDHSKYTTAIATLNKANVDFYIRKHKITEAQVLLEAIKRSFYNFKTQREYAGRFPEKWIPSTFMIVDEQFTEQNNQMNSTLKIVRYKIREAYKELIDFMYKPEGSPLDNERNMTVIKNLLKK